MPYSLVEVYRRYRGPCCLHLEGSALCKDMYCNNYIYLCVVTSGAPKYVLPDGYYLSDEIGYVDKGRSLWHTWGKRINMLGLCGGRGR